MAVFTDEQINEILSIFRQNLGHRQYIGARYVPIFGRRGETSIEWDNSAPYEPLTIVLYQGNSYTSRQYVPAGIDIDNVDFWAETGNYNAQIEQYRQEVLSFDGRIDANENAISKLQKEKINLYDFPVYVGRDVINEADTSASQFAAIVGHDNAFYGFFNTNQNTNKTYLRKYDIESGIITPAGDAQNGHANSACYIDSTDKILCAWYATYASGQSVETNKISEYDANFNFLRIVETENIYFSISYDSVAEKLYGLTIPVRTGNTKISTLYELDPITYAVRELIGQIDISYTATTLQQDMAINDGLVYINTPGGLFNVYSIDDLDTVLYQKTLPTTDQYGVYAFGEFEGIEFDNQNTLYGATTIHFGYSVIGCCVCLSNLKVKSKEYVGGSFRRLFVSNDYKLKWNREATQLASIAESSMIIHPTVEKLQLVDGLVDKCYYSTILNMNRNLIILIPANATVTITPIKLSSENLTFMTDDNAVVNFEQLPTTANRHLIDASDGLTTKVTFNNRGTINSDVDREMVHLAYNKNILTVGGIGTSNITLKTGNTTLEANTLYIGSAYKINSVVV